MKIDRLSLASALKTVAGSVSRTRTTHDAYRCVLIDGPAGQIYTTNGEASSTVAIDMLDDPSVAMLKHDDLSSIVDVSSAEQIEIIQYGGVVKVHSGSTEYALPRADTDTMPRFDASVKDAPDTLRFTLPLSKWQEAIDKTAFAACKQEMKYAMNSVAVILRDGTLYMTATDAKRLSLVQLQSVENLQFIERLLPVPFVQTHQRLTGETITVAIDRNTASAQVGGNLFTTRLVGGRFPPVFDIIPKKPVLNIRLTIPDWIQAIREVMPATEADSKRLSITCTGGTATLVCQGATTGRATTTLGVEPGDWSINIDPALLLEALRSFDGSTVELAYTSPERPLLLQQPGHKHIIMPLS